MGVTAWPKIIAVLIIIIIAIVVLVIFKIYRTQADNLHDVFGTVTYIGELPQLQYRQPLKSYNNWNGFRSYNPSLFSLDDRNCYYVYRLCNFTLCPGVRNQWRMGHRDKTISHTVIQSPTGSLAIVKHPQLAKLYKYDGERNCEQGGEDARPIVVGKKLYLITNATTGDNCRRQMILMQLNLQHLKDCSRNSDGDLAEIVPDKIWQLHYEDGEHRDQKNWMPFTVGKSSSNNLIDDDLHFVYSVNPHVILKFDKVSGDCHKIASTWNCNLSEDLRGGSQIIRVTKWNPRSKNGLTGELRYYPEELYLGVLHKRDSTFEYMTYIYAFEVKYPYRVKYITDGFVFGEYGSHSKRIQFAAGLARIISDDCAYLYITYGENDCMSKVCVLKEEDVLRSLIRV